MQVSLLGVPPDGTIVQIDAGNAISPVSIATVGTGVSISKSFINGALTLKSLIATTPLAIANNPNDLTFSVDLSAYALVTALSGYVPTTRAITTLGPLTGGGALSSNLTVSMPMATSLASGYLLNTDWIAFNGKQNALGFTPANSLITLTAGLGLTGGGDLSNNRAFDVNVDGATIEISSDVLRVKDGGITSAKLAVGAFVQSPDGNQLYTKVIDIGAWNMDSTNAVFIAHGLADQSKIRFCKVDIRPDVVIGASTYYNLDLQFNTGGPQGGVAGWDNVTINLYRLDSGFFDNVAIFGDNFLNRGHITIFYSA